ncbi:heterogeneous nuclear ribonucleoprotein C1/C2 [Pelomyxa schiedti]|nr:heterogeneous nuclear ribonucleoprotein C1/C2 [Pelomyxa schiedti]
MMQVGARSLYQGNHYGTTKPTGWSDPIAPITQFQRPNGVPVPPAVPRVNNPYAPQQQQQQQQQQIARDDVRRPFERSVGVGSGGGSGWDDRGRSYERPGEREATAIKPETGGESSSVYNPNSRIFLGNLPSERTSKQELNDIFSRYGRILEIVIRKSFGFVQFERASSAQAAIDGENGRLIGHCKLDINLADSRPRRRRDNSRSRSPPSRSPPSRHSSPPRNADVQANQIPISQIFYVGPSQRSYASKVEGLLKDEVGFSSEIKLMERQSIRAALQHSQSEGVRYVMVLGRENVDRRTVALNLLHALPNDRPEGYDDMNLNEAIDMVAKQESLVSARRRMLQQAQLNYQQPNYPAQTPSYTQAQPRTYPPPPTQLQYTQNPQMQTGAVRPSGFSPAHPYNPQPQYSAQQQPTWSQSQSQPTYTASPSYASQNSSYPRQQPYTNPTQQNPTYTSDQLYHTSQPANTTMTSAQYGPPPVYPPQQKVPIQPTSTPGNSSIYQQQTQYTQQYPAQTQQISTQSQAQIMSQQVQPNGALPTQVRSETGLYNYQSSTSFVPQSSNVSGNTIPGTSPVYNVVQQSSVPVPPTVSGGPSGNVGIIRSSVDPASYPPSQQSRQLYSNPAVPTHSQHSDVVQTSGYPYTTNNAPPPTTSQYQTQYTPEAQPQRMQQAPGYSTQTTNTPTVSSYTDYNTIVNAVQSFQSQGQSQPNNNNVVVPQTTQQTLAQQQAAARSVVSAGLPELGDLQARLQKVSVEKPVGPVSVTGSVNPYLHQQQQQQQQRPNVGTTTGPTAAAPTSSVMNSYTVTGQYSSTARSGW